MERYEEIAGKTLRLFQTDYERHGLMAASYAVALDRFLSGPIGLSIVGSRKRKDFSSFKLHALRAYPARRSILYLDPSADLERMKKLGYERPSQTTAYVCVGKVCGPPLKEPAKIESSISSLLSSNAPSAVT